ncbi:TPA: hypothetical protein ACGATL_000283 [Raoultella ornithinolytica]
MTSEIRRATANDVALFYGVSAPPASMRGVAIVVNGEVLGIGGVSMSIGCPVAFMNIREEAQRYPILIMKATAKLKQDVFSLYKCPIYAQRDMAVESSGRYLSRLGFTPMEENSEVYIWRPQSRSLCLPEQQ